MWSPQPSGGMRIDVREGWIKVAFFIDFVSNNMGITFIFDTRWTRFERDVTMSGLYKSENWFVLSDSDKRVAIANSVEYTRIYQALLEAGVGEVYST
jgi:hypothetical protein